MAGSFFRSSNQKSPSLQGSRRTRVSIGSRYANAAGAVPAVS